MDLIWNACGHGCQGLGILWTEYDATSDDLRTKILNSLLRVLFEAAEDYQEKFFLFELTILRRSLSYIP